MFRVLMVGPDPSGRGGISRVVKMWRDSGLFEEYGVSYLSSVGEGFWRRWPGFWISVGRFLTLVYQARLVYIHTASRGSFYRKAVFVLVALGFGKPVVLHVHSAFFAEFVGAFGIVRRCAFLPLLKRVKAVVALTENIADAMEDVVPGLSLRVIGNPVDVAGMSNPSAIARSNDRVCYLGWYTKGKGVYDLVDAVEILGSRGTKLRLEMFGTHGEEYLKAYVAFKGMASVIRVHGWIDDTRKLEELYESALLVLPSYTEGMPNVVLEAMATHTPVVCTAVGGLREVVKDGENALVVEVGNAAVLADRIENALASESLRTKVAANAFTMVRERFDLPIVMSQVRGLIEEYAVTGRKQVG